MTSSLDLALTNLLAEIKANGLAIVWLQLGPQTALKNVSIANAFNDSEYACITTPKGELIIFRRDLPNATKPQAL